MKKFIFIFFILRAVSSNSQIMDWVSLPQEVNDIVYDLNVYNGKLIASGQFTFTGTAPSNKIASWDGTSWAPLGSGVRSGFNPFAYKSIVFNNELFVVGNFDSAGTTACKDIAKWNGSSWSGFGSGSNAAIYSISFFNNEMYVGGTFDTINGIPAKHIAKWNGTNWQSLGTGIQGTNVNDMYVFQNELYVIGVLDSAGNIPCNYIARWNGTTWNNVSTGLSYGSSAIIQRYNKLIVGSQGILLGGNYYQDTKQWDGTNWSMFSHQMMTNIRKFLIFNNNFYAACGLAAGPAGSSMVNIWDSISSSWKMVGTGVNNYTQALCVFNNELYCGGFFNKANNGYHNFIARYGNATGVKEFSNSKCILSVYPNPTSSFLNFKDEPKEFENSEIEILNSLGQTLLKQPYSKNFDVSDLVQGYYNLKIISREQIYYTNFIKQ